MKIKNIPHVLMIVISLAYSSYVVTHYLNGQFNLIVSVIGAIVLAGLGHYYLCDSAYKSAVNKKLHQGLLLGVGLCAVIWFMEWQGTLQISTNNLVKTERLSELQTLATKQRSMILEKSNSNKWQNVEAKRDLIKGLSSIEKAIKEEKQVISKQKQQAQDSANEFRFFSVFFVIASLISASCFEREQDFTSLEDNTYVRIQQQKPTKQQDLSQDIATRQEQDLSVFSGQNLDKSLTALSTQERINKASEYIKITKETDQRKLMPLFRLNVSGVSKAKKLAGVDSKKNTKQKNIGF